MENYWRRVESCNYRPGWRRLRRLGLNSTGHGWRGWTFSERGYRQLFRDMQLVDVILSAAKGLGYRPSDAINLLGLPPFVATVVRRGGKFAKTLLKTFVPVASAIFDYSDPVTEFISERGWLKRFWWLLDDPLDPNDRRLTDDPSHIGYVPLSTRSHRRFGTRERLLDMACRRPDRLHVQLNALATRVILDKDNRAIGIEYLQRERSNVDDPIGKDERQDPQQVLAARGVILACGAFNTPQLLMLSGIGPKVVLERVQICPRIDLPGVGRNLRDHYEINVIQRMKANWLSRKGSRYEKGDEQYQHWKRGSDGSYAFTGAVLALARKSDSSNIAPDMLITALLYPFKGYYRGYSRVAAEIGDVLTWSIMKSMSNGDGVVTLRSADPCDAPVVDFNYFVGDSRNDLRSLVDGIRFVRELTAKLTQKRLIIEEEAPGKDFIADEELIQFARDTASGRNAAGSCGIGPVAAGGVLDSDFRVHGTKGLYVVDASALPRLPCCHIASTIYMAAEKAADGILREATGSKAVLKF